MAASKDDISGWFDTAQKKGSAFLIVVCDTFDHDDYPVYVKQPEDFWVNYELYNGKNMQRIMEVYDLSLPKDEQMNESRAWHLPAKRDVA